MEKLECTLCHLLVENDPEALAKHLLGCAHADSEVKKIAYQAVAEARQVRTDRVVAQVRVHA